jgi:hypothetical protein
VDDDATIRSALQQHRADLGIAADGGVDDRWVVMKLGPVPLPFPNTPARRRVVDLHDVHHLLSGFHTDNPGEGEISAWELGSGGCGRYLAAWGLDLAGLMLIVVWPRRVFSAFRSGRRTRNGYRYDFEALEQKTLGQVRRELVRPPRGAFASLTSDLLWLGVMLLAAIPTGVALFLLVLVSTPVWVCTKDRNASAIGLG